MGWILVCSHACTTVVKKTIVPLPHIIRRAAIHTRRVIGRPAGAKIAAITTQAGNVGNTKRIVQCGCTWIRQWVPDALSPIRPQGGPLTGPWPDALYPPGPALLPYPGRKYLPFGPPWNDQPPPALPDIAPAPVPTPIEHLPWVPGGPDLPGGTLPQLPPESVPEPSVFVFFAMLACIVILWRIWDDPRDDVDTARGMMTAAVIMISAYSLLLLLI